MLLKYYKFLLLGLFLLISGCIQTFPCESKFSINKLPEAIVNQQYLQLVEISGGAMINENDLKWEITPEYSGLAITRITDKESALYGGVEISGVPKYQGEITIWIYESGYGPPCHFGKTFILKVNAPIEQSNK